MLTTLIILTLPTDPTAAGGGGAAAAMAFGHPVVETFEATVTRIAAADTVEAVADGRKVIVRLAGVHALDPTQRYHAAAEQIVARVLLGKTVEVRAITPRGYGQCVADVRLQGRSVSESLVAAGLVWHYDEACESESLAAMQTAARTRGRGLWKFAVAGDMAPPWKAAEATMKSQADAAAALAEAERAADREAPVARVASAGGTVKVDGIRAQRRRDARMFDSRTDEMVFR